MNNEEKKKPEYVRPELVMISYAAENVIFASGETGGSDETGGSGMIELPEDPF